MEFSLLGWVGGFEKVILFYVFSCGLEKIALIGSKNGQTPDFTVVSILLTRTSLQQIFNISGYILICEPKLRLKVLTIPSLACCLNVSAKKSVCQFIVPAVPSYCIS